MIDEFQAFLLLVVTGLFVSILFRVARSDLAAQSPQSRRAAPNRRPPSP
jgi:hypothetical protein